MRIKFTTIHHVENQNWILVENTFPSVKDSTTCNTSLTKRVLLSNLDKKVLEASAEIYMKETNIPYVPEGKTVVTLMPFFGRCVMPVELINDKPIGAGQQTRDYRTAISEARSKAIEVSKMLILPSIESLKFFTGQ